MCDACCATRGGEGGQSSPKGLHISAPERDAPTHHVTAPSTMRTAVPTQRSPHVAHSTGAALRGGAATGGGPHGTPWHPTDPWVPRGSVTPYIFTVPPLQAAKLPMSIIIVGVGQAEFDGEAVLPPRGPCCLGGLIALSPPPLPAAMVELDGDDIRISSRGKVAERDIVQVWDPPSPVLW